MTPAPHPGIFLVIAHNLYVSSPVRHGSHFRVKSRAGGRRSDVIVGVVHDRPTPTHCRSRESLHLCAGALIRIAVSTHLSASLSARPR